jgi:alkylhydroperoxidase family enzyme
MSIEFKVQDHQHLLHGYSSRARRIATLPKLNSSSTCRVKITKLETMVAATKETAENHCKMCMTAFLANGRRLGMKTISKN